MGVDESHFSSHLHPHDSTRMKVALDAMGGDHAPAVNIGGAIGALQVIYCLATLPAAGGLGLIRLKSIKAFCGREYGSPISCGRATN